MTESSAQILERIKQNRWRDLNFGMLFACIAGIHYLDGPTGGFLAGFAGLFLSLALLSHLVLVADSRLSEEFADGGVWEEKGGRMTDDLVPEGVLEGVERHCNYCGSLRHTSNLSIEEYFHEGSGNVLMLALCDYCDPDGGSDRDEGLEAAIET